MMQVQLNTSFPHPLLFPHWTELVIARETLDGVVDVERRGPLMTSHASCGACICPRANFSEWSFKSRPRATAA